MADNFFAQGDFTKTQSARIIDTLFELVKKFLEDGEDVLISGFRKFSVNKKYQRRGRNPQTGDPMTLLAGKIVTIKWSKVLQAAMNGEGK